MLINFLVCFTMLSFFILCRKKLNKILDILVEKYLSIESGFTETGSAFAKTLLNKKGTSDTYIGFKDYPNIGSASATGNYILLNPALYSSTSIIALAVSAHEAGHITQRKGDLIELCFGLISCFFFTAFEFGNIQLIIKNLSILGIILLVFVFVLVFNASLKFTGLIRECDATRKALADLRVYISEQKTYALAKKWLFLALLKYSTDLLIAICLILFILFLF